VAVISPILKVFAKYVSLACLFAPLAACGYTTGDFGRPHSQYTNSSYWPIIAQAAKAWREEPQSFGGTTDDERELRDRSWHFLMPQFPQNRFDELMAQMRVDGILPPVTGTVKEIYLNMLLSADPFRSLASRYRKLAEDVEADRVLIGEFKQIYARVVEGDRVRRRSLEHVHELTDGERADTLARIDENIALNKWVHRDLCYRIDMYRYAVERLVLMGPMREAIYAERGVNALSVECQAAPPPNNLRLKNAKSGKRLITK
jgi:hypothetical protein